MVRLESRLDFILEVDQGFTADPPVRDRRKMFTEHAPKLMALTPMEGIYNGAFDRQDTDFDSRCGGGDLGIPYAPRWEAGCKGLPTEQGEAASDLQRAEDESLLLAEFAGSEAGDTGQLPTAMLDNSSLLLNRHKARGGRLEKATGASAAGGAGTRTGKAPLLFL